jgi:hypothetical protein
MRQNRATILILENKYILHILSVGLQPSFGQNRMSIGSSDICVLSGHKILLNIIS